GFHAAGMTFEKYDKVGIDVRAYEHFVAMWTSLFSAASNKERILTEWHASYVDARNEGSAGTLEPNGIYYTGKTLFQPVPANLSIRHYFLLDEPDRSRELAALIRRLQRMDVKVYRLDKPLSVPDFRRYGEVPSLVTLPSGTYWVPMAQAQKHWIQAMLHENPYIPVTVSYDVSAWSNPLLMNIAGGSSGAALKPSAGLVPPVAEPALPGPPPGAPRIGLFQIPGSSGITSAGSIRYLFQRVWGVPFTEVDASQIQAGLSGVDVLLVPDGYASYGLQALGSKGQRALADWVAAGGKYVGYVGGAELAVKAGVSTAVLKPSNTSAPGALIRAKLDEGSILAQGVGPAAWVMYDDNNLMTPGLGEAAATFPAAGDPYYHTSGLAIGVDELAGTAAVVDEAVGAGRSIVFSFDPNFRAWSDGTQRVLWNALFAPEPVAAAAAPAKVRASAVDRAGKAAALLPDMGKAIRIVVHSSDADTARALIQRYGAEFKESGKSDRTIFLIENRKGLSREEHPFIIDLARELGNQITPISISVP
ncbi:MAG TPA: hypothetical protein VFI43_05920, partial [Nitrosospira sp.]|nr:hypothetical protein [Nitrosospira sp.]